MEQIENRQYNSPHASFRFYVALATAIITILTFAIAIMTPPLSGPFCKEGCFEYPYTDIASRFPRDYYFMYPTMFISVLHVLLMVSIHDFASPVKKLFSLTGLSFALISAAVLIPNYFIQLAVIQPSLVNGETGGIALLTQYNPHGIFIALDEAGFLLMNISFFAVAPVFSTKTTITKSIRIILITAFILAVISLLFISISYGIRREYIFEVAIISIVWLELIFSSILLSVVFRREMKFKAAGD